jgi:hypothetical protein
MTHEHKSVPSTFDAHYQQKSVAYNTAMVPKRYFLKEQAEWQSMQVAAQHGFVSGAYYGAIFGLGVAVYKRQISPLFRYSIGWGVAYGGLLTASNYFRTDL